MFYTINLLVQDCTDCILGPVSVQDELALRARNIEHRALLKCSFKCQESLLTGGGPHKVNILFQKCKQRRGQLGKICYERPVITGDAQE